VVREERETKIVRAIENFGLILERRG
jgi:hypothetical protein